VALVTALFIRWFPQELGINYTEKPSFKSQRKSLDQGLDPWQSLWLQDLLGRAIVLVLLSFALCLVISVLGGLFAVIIERFNPSPAYSPLSPELNFRLALVRRNLPALVVAIGSRIPMNLLDRLISSFVGYGLAVLLAWGGRKLGKHRKV
jgi:hypothetical protein